MKKLLLIAGAVCALALFSASAEAAHGCGSPYGYGYGARCVAPGYGYGCGYRGCRDYYPGHLGGGCGFYPSRRVQAYGGVYNYRRERVYGPGLHIGGRRFHAGFHF